ncbi:hypothetical protein FQN57_005819 [Myotisia sp. PD_48]|nr:hypothetical protein FQN57_005819 [Myotisia sp. PD_48]
MGLKSIRPLASLKHLLLLGLGASNVAALSLPRQESGGPSFAPPPNAGSTNQLITCEYPSMPGWVHDADSKRGWLKWAGEGEAPAPGKYDIETDNEHTWPKGILRQYTLTIEEGTVNLDGEPFIHAKLFEKKYPGPWIQACWGDEIEITVKNRLQYNGTAIHWHGIRQFENLLMDGVPGLTQCPIAPGKDFVYRFTATQYGSTWYHSHYSLQYSDGLVGPLTIHGPSSAEYDESIDPFIMTDHMHRQSAFEEYHRVMYQGRVPNANLTLPGMDSLLLNGIGNYNNDPARKPFSTVIQKGKKYLLRLINTSTDAAIVVSFDNHRFTVVGADLVPIKPYETDHILVGIGQRYHIILNALPDAQDGDAFWIRMRTPTGCGRWENRRVPSEKMGLLYYGTETDQIPVAGDLPIVTNCTDELATNLVPVQRWTIPDPKLSPTDMIVNKAFKPGAGNWSAPGRTEDDTSINNWSLGDDPMWLDYSKPIVRHLDDESVWQRTWVVHKSENFTYDNFVYMVISGMDAQTFGGVQVNVSHPIHLHGHDFAILQQSYLPFSEANLKLELIDPPRRDVALLPRNGFLVIAFKLDNPGAWLMHCHIGWHASAGFALQILESKDLLLDYMTSHQDDVNAMNQNCVDWNNWFDNSANHYPGEEYFQDDSGI